MRPTIALTCLLAGCVDDLAATERIADPMPACTYTQRTAHTAEELRLALAAGPGQRIEIPSGISINLSAATYHALRVPSCTTITGHRGGLDRGALLYSNDLARHTMFDLRGNDIRIEGLRIRGPVDPDVNRSNSLDPSTGIDITLAPSDDPSAYQGRDIVIENNELFWWPYAAVSVEANGGGWSMPEDVPSGTPLVGWGNVDEVVVRKNYIHHNAMNGLGYGVKVDDAAFATIERNTFDYNRHSIASDGRPHTGYRARHNYVLDGGYSESNNGFDYWNQHFDVHGSGSDGYGGVAGERYEIAYNTFRGAQGYGVYPLNYQRPCTMVRATPMERIDFDSNVALQWSDQCLRRKGKGSPVDRVYEADTTYHLDTHDELGVGDFDGDTDDDVIITTGAAWYYSSGARTEWRYLRNSGIRVASLGFADIDNDGTTDILARLSDGYINVAYRGTSSWTPLTPSTESITEIRFGDFDGDGLTDMFRRQPTGRWMFWYGRTQTWIEGRTSSIAIEDLRFGYFDTRPGMDVLATSGNSWVLSSNGTGAWVTHSDALVPLRETRVGDFDGDGASDIVHGGNGVWHYADRGRGPWRVLRDDGGISIADIQLGDFDGSGVTDAVRYASDRRFEAWVKERGDAFATWSWQTMK